MTRKYSRSDWTPTIALGAILLGSAAVGWLSLAETNAQTADGSFAAGNRVVALVRTPVKASPDGEQMLGLPLPGGQGTIEQGPHAFGGERWWRVAFDEGFSGWAREDDLQVHEPGVKAFPTAEGFGADALGGRGGVVIEVTNLDDSGPGSLRDAVEQEGPRTVVFRVGGTIAVERPIRIRDPYVTIAGQTAPGDGILIRNHPANTDAPITIETHDVVIRHLRLRPGPSGEPSCCVDALGLMQGAREVIIDHVSLSWSVDELLGASEDASDFTVQWSILSEALHRSNHAKDDRHSRALLVSTQEGGNVSIHHNLFAHNDGRNPEVALAYGIADIVNNVLYNPGVRMIEISEANAKPYANVVGNVMRNGKNTKRNNPHINNHIVRARDVDDGAREGFVMYVVGNLDDLYRTDDAMPETVSVIEEDRRFLATERQPAPFVATTLAERAYADVLERAGAILPRRDAVDERILATVHERTGKIINDPSDVGGWPRLASGTPPVDSDHDGMPDAWEKRLGLDPEDPDDRNGDVTGNGYTNLEDYLNELAGDIRLSRPRDSASLEGDRQR
jgi:pectate lyase